MGVGRIVRVPLWAVGFGGIKRRDPKASARVDLVSDRFHVSRVDTKTNATQVVNGEPFRDRSYQQFVSEAVGVHVTPGNLKVAIAVVCRPSRPEPAGAKFGAVVRDGSALLNLRPKALFRSTLGLHRILQWFGVMGQAALTALPLHCTTLAWAQ